MWLYMFYIKHSEFKVMNWNVSSFAWWFEACLVFQGIKSLWFKLLSLLIDWLIDWPLKSLKRSRILLKRYANPIIQKGCVFLFIKWKETMSAHSSTRSQNCQWRPDNPSWYFHVAFSQVEYMFGKQPPQRRNQPWWHFTRDVPPKFSTVWHKDVPYYTK